MTDVMNVFANLERPIQTGTQRCRTSGALTAKSVHCMETVTAPRDPSLLRASMMRLGLIAVLFLVASQVLGSVGAEANEGTSPERAIAKSEATTPKSTDGEAAIEPPHLHRLLTRQEVLAGTGSNSLLRQQAADVVALYLAIGNRPIWIDGDRLTGDALAFRRYLDSIVNHGLRSQDYLTEAIDSRWMSMDEQSRAELEILLSRSFVTLARDLWYGRTRWAGERVQHFAIEPVDFKIIDFAVEMKLRGALAAITLAEPKNTQYQQLVAGLKQRLDMANDPLAKRPDLPVGRTLKIGTRDKRVAILREILTVTGDLPAVLNGAASETSRDQNKQSPDQHHFDKGLEDAVKRYQERHGLGVDGAVGPQTTAHLNQDAEDEIDHLKASLERWRLLPRIDDDRYIIVNIPGFELHAYQSGFETVSMRTVVGRFKRKTPTFSSNIDRIVVNPTWTVPKTIMREDYLPKLQEDPGYLDKKGIQIYSGWGADREVIDPYSIDWNVYSAGERIPFMMRQPPGRDNALGRVKFLMPNNDSIYLHDTNSPRLFNRARRAYSSGCVRLSDPNAFADYLMRGDSELGDRTSDDIIRGSSQRWYSLGTPVPVHLTYLTAWARPNGEIEFKEDIYRRTAHLLRQLERSSANPDADQLARVLLPVEPNG